MENTEGNKQDVKQDNKQDIKQDNKQDVKQDKQNIKPKEYVCKDCGARYKTETNYNQHFKTNAHKLKVKNKPKNERLEEIPRKSSKDDNTSTCDKYGNQIINKKIDIKTQNTRSNRFDILADLND